MLWVLCMTHHLNVLYKCMKFDKISLTVIKVLSGHDFVTDRQIDRRTDVITIGFLVGTYSVRKSSQESISTQQILGNFYRINLILRNFRNLKYPSRSIREYGWTDTRGKTIHLLTLKGGDITNK